MGNMVGLNLHIILRPRTSYSIAWLCFISLGFFAVYSKFSQLMRKNSEEPYCSSFNFVAVTNTTTKKQLRSGKDFFFGLVFSHSLSLGEIKTGVQH